MGFLRFAGIERRTLKNGPRIWIKCTFHQMWMLPERMEFECGDIYRRVGFSWRRCAAYYRRVEVALT